MTPTRMLEADFAVARRTFDVSALLCLGPGERLSLFGPSGAGKTTCLEAIAGTVPLKSGRIQLDGRLVNLAKTRRRRLASLAEQPVPPLERGVAVVRQPTTLFPHMNVRANVAYGLGGREPQGARSIEDLLEHVGLGGLAGAMPDALSGGQRQRACLARAIARPFRALLLDEPFSAVDAASRSTLRSIAVEATTRADAVAVLVTHDLAEAQAFGHRIGIMDDGRILQLGGTDELVRQPATVRVAELCGYRSFVPHESGKLWALHPDRFVEGAWPQRGVVLSGIVRSVQPFGPRFACEMTPCGHLEGNGADIVAAVGPPLFGEITPGQNAVRIHVDAPPRVGDTWEVTSLSPPLVSRVAVMGGAGRMNDCQIPAAIPMTD
jgi:ABC-type Fe3+/spermidine/putrescine transport system ATPase subunit